MIGYLDTSALMPLLVDGPTSRACARFWDDADDVITSRVTYVEAAAALAMAERFSRLTQAQHRAALRRLDRYWSELDVVEVDDELVRRAAALARRLSLRGYDAVQCASAESLAEPDLVAASGDRSLLTAWGAVGVDTYDTHGA